MKCIVCKQELPEGSVYCLRCGRKQIHEKKPRQKGKRPNGTGSVYREGKTWTAEITRGYTHVDGKDHRLRKRKRGFPTKAAALEYCAMFSKIPEIETQTLEQLWAAWSTSDMTKLSDSKQEAYTIAHNKLLKTDIAFSRIDALRLEDLQKAMDSQCKTFYTARDFKNLLSKLYQRAMIDKQVSVNLSKALTMPDLEEDEPIPFSDIEQANIWKAYGAGDKMAGYILVMIYSGMMPGELLACRKENIDWANFQIIKSGKKTKTRKEVPLVFPDIIEPVLRDLCEYSDGPKLLTMNKDRFYKAYYQTIEAAGCRKLPPYSCRHTTATSLAKESIPAALMQKIMRHAKFQSTLRYIHHDTSDMRSAVNQVASGAKRPKTKAQ